MKLRGLEVEQFRKFDRPVRLTGFGDRVNVLCGPNEFGKSTMLAAIRGLLFERHNSKAEAIKRMQHWRGNAAPRLAMDFETGGGVWRIEKRFLSQPMARLTGPDGSRFDNDAAEEELQRLLGFAAAGKQGAKPEMMGVWGALWVTQRDSVLQADLSSELARSTITSCLDAEVGVLTGTELGQALIRSVREQRGQILDGNGKPRGRYKDVAVALEAVAARLAELDARSQRLGEDSAAFRTASEKLARESDPAADQRDQEALADARRKRETSLLHEAQLQRAQLAADLAQRGLNDALQEQQSRADRTGRLGASDIACRGGQARLQIARAAEQAADASYAACRRDADAAQERFMQAGAAARNARALAELVRRAAHLQQHRTLLEQASAAEQDFNATTARLANLQVTPERLDAIRKAARDLDAAQSRLHAQATHIHVELDQDGAGKIAIRGAPLAASTAISIIDETELTIAGIGRLRIVPAIEKREEQDRRIDKARDLVAAACRSAGCVSLAEAEARYTEREAAQRALADAKAMLERLTPGDKPAGIAPGIGALRDHVTVLQAQLQNERQAPGMQELPSLADALARAKAAEDEDETAGEALRQARAASDAGGDRSSEARAASSRIETSVATSQSEHTRLLAETAAAEAHETAEALAARLETCRSAQDSSALALASLQRQQPAESAEFMQARIERYEQALALRAQTIRRLRESMAELRARIAQEGGNGLDEQIAAAQRERDALALERDAFVRDTKIVNLLLETLTIAERETKERYLAPVIRRVTPYLRSLFPGADIACDDALRITGLTRDAAGTEDFERLSDGTQEQIAVLSRLAFAEMLIDQGKPAMVILDDALAYADADRMERMFDIITRASAKTQILVLTCREDLFSRLGGNRIELVRADMHADQGA